MDHVNMEASLHSMIDPGLLPEEHGHPQHEAEGRNKENGDGEQATEGQDDQGADGGQAPPPVKKRGLVPGSTADFRRREANRLAADRSRSRANEKRTSLELAQNTLSEENLRLKQEIAKLEKPEGIIEEQEITTTSGNEAQDSHSRTILAALMSGDVDDAFEPGQEVSDEWMQGVEDMLLKEAESSGRLGELAAVAAAGRNDSAANGQEAEATSEHQGEGNAEPAQGSTEEVQAAVRQVELSLPKKFVYNPTAAAAAAASQVAVALNAELEKSLRNDLASTKAAIAKVDREIARIRALQEQGEEVEHEEERDIDRQVSLPDVVLTATEEELRTEAEEKNKASTKLQQELPVLREMVTRMKDAKLEEEAKLAAAVVELQSFSTPDGDEDREKVAAILKSVGGFVGSLLSGSRFEQNGDGQAHSGSGSFSSPAIARRRRGRPPKNQGVASYTRAADSQPPAPSPLRSSSTAEPSEKKGKGRAKSSTLQNVPSAEEQTPQEAQDEVDTAHQYILSHLQGSSSFADFLPQSTNDLQGHLSPTLNQGENPPLPPTAEAEGAEHVDPNTPHVLSRLRKGPPGSCDICNRTETSVWRKLVLAGRDLKVCNACGLYHTKFGVLRPPELWGDGKSLKKRRPTTRPSRENAEGDGEGRASKRSREDKEIEEGEEEAPEGEVGIEDLGEELHDLKALEQEGPLASML